MCTKHGDWKCTLQKGSFYVYFYLAYKLYRRSELQNLSPFTFESIVLFWTITHYSLSLSNSKSLIKSHEISLAGADLGFGKGGCPIHQKGATSRKAHWRCALPGVSRANPENWKFRTLRCIFPAFRGTIQSTTYMTECAFMVFCRQYYPYIVESDNRPKWRLAVQWLSV